MIDRISFFIFSLLIGFSNTHINAQKKQPNIIYILADDLGFGDVGFNGQTKIKTPTLDRLAKEGIKFNKHYAGSTVCGPSRASLLTGMHTGHSTVRGNPRWTKSGKPVDFNDQEITIAEEMKRAGYRTGIVGKWALAENLGVTQPNQQGFDYFYGFNKHLPAHHYYPEEIWENEKLLKLEGNNTKGKKGVHVQELFTQKALDFIDRENKKPFFLYLAYTTPHYELTIPEKFKEQYRKENWPLRALKDGHYHNDPNGHVTYAAMVTKMDSDIQRVLDKLKEHNLHENTLVIFTSDNGHEYDNTKNEFFNSNGVYKGHKRDLYEGGIRMPFVAWWPNKIPAGTASDHMSAFWDVKATFCDLVGNKPKGKTDGISFLPSLLGKNKKQKEHKYLYWEFNEGRGPIQALTKKDWKLIYFIQKKQYELYNLTSDPSEENNLYSQNPKKAKELKKLLRKARTEHSEFPLVKKGKNRKKTKK